MKHQLRSNTANERQSRPLDRTWKTVSGFLVFLLQGWCSFRLHAEDHVDYKFEEYDETRDRIQIQTHSVLFEVAAGGAVTVQGEAVYDSISGATPTGGPPPAGSDQVPLAHMEDTRYAGSLGTAIAWGRNTTTPQVAYSYEHDYESIGISLNHSIDFNQKNTTLNLGVAHNFDTVMPSFWYESKSKDSTGFLVGGTQLLGPKTVVSANLTIGIESGYLSDPYKGFVFTGYDPASLFPENRPSTRDKQIFLASLTHFFESVNGSVEGSYRFYHDTFDIFSQTAGLEWFQKIGNHVIVSPGFRYYRQSAAYFYATELPGDPTTPPGSPFYTGPVPDYYSADYRLSNMQTFTYGLKLTVIINSHVYLDAAYKRYEMQGLDGVTSASAYPDANVFTVGARIWF